MRNIEALKNYFLGKDPQLQETMADNSLRLIGIPGREFVLRTELLQRLKTLRDELTEKDEELQEEIDDLIEDLENVEDDVIDLKEWKQNNNFVFAEDLDLALSRYYTKTEADNLLDDKQDALTAGTGIDITNNVISATGGGLPTLESDVDATDNLLLLDEGIYYSGDHVVTYYDSSLQENIAIVPNNALFFYSAAYNTFETINLTEWGIANLVSYKYVWDNEENKWTPVIIGRDTIIGDSPSDGGLPTSKAVADYVGNLVAEQAQDTKTVSASGTGTISVSVTDGLNEKIGFTSLGVSFIDEDLSSYVCNGTEVAGTRYYFTDYSRINVSMSLPKSYYSFQMPSVVAGDVISFSYSVGNLSLNGVPFVYPSSSYNEPQYERLIFEHTTTEPSGTYTLTLSNSDSSQTQEETITWGDSLATNIVLRNGVFQYRRPYKKIDSYNGETITTTSWYSNLGDLLTGATVYYADAEYVDITDETLLEKLNNIVSFSTYEGTTIFSMTTQDSNSHSFYLSYQRTLKALIAENSAHYYQTYQTKSNILIATNSRLVSDTYYPSTGYMFKFLDQVEGEIPTITSSTTDIGAGSALATGDIYFVYE